MASCLELPDRSFAVAGEDEDIPVFVSHDEGVLDDEDKVQYVFAIVDRS